MEKSDQNVLYQLVFATAAEGVIIADRDGVIEDANERATQLFGYSREEFIGSNVDRLLPKQLAGKHVDQRKAYAEKPRKRPMGKGYDLSAVRKDGSTFPIEISLNYYENEDTFKVMALIMDVSERKEQEAQVKMLNKTLEERVKKRTRELRESEQLYSSIARNFPNGVINVFDRNLNYIFVEGEELFRFGITSEKLVGKNYIERLPEEVQPVLRGRLTKVLQGENQSFEINLNDQDYLINAVALMNEKNEVDRILMVEQNITTQKRAEASVREALEKEKHLNELKSRFVSLASHEFRTPLSTVLSSLSLLEKYDAANIAEKRPKHYKRIRSSVRHLTNILNDFLSVEKLQSGMVKVNPSVFSAHQLLQELCDQHQEIAKPGQQVSLTYEGDEDVHTDMHMFHIVVTNLLSNAIKYSKEGKVIEVFAINGDETFELRVRDHGIGIPVRDQQNMFERFFRAKNATNIEGTGLGLNIVHRYMQMLNGSIKFHSEVDEGTTFIVHIPQNI